MAFRILGFLDLWPHYSYLWAIFTLPLPLLSVKSPLCVRNKYTYIHISVLIGTPRKTTTLRSGSKKKRGEGAANAANALLRLVSVQLPRHMSRRKEYLCFTLMYLMYLHVSNVSCLHLITAGTTDHSNIQLCTSANMYVQHVDI